MRLYFQDGSGRRIAIDTERREYCADYLNPETIIDDAHRFITVSDPQALYIVESEADFCGWAYSDEFLKDRPGAPADTGTDPAAQDAEIDDEPF